MITIHYMPVVTAQSIYKQLQYPLYDTNEATDECFAGSGSISGVRFPAISNLAELEKRIDDFIKTRYPQSALKGYADDFIKYGQQFDVNPVIPVMIAAKEIGRASCRERVWRYV